MLGQIYQKMPLILSIIYIFANLCIVNFLTPIVTLRTVCNNFSCHAMFTQFSGIRTLIAESTVALKDDINTVSGDLHFTES